MTCQQCGEACQGKLCRVCSQAESVERRYGVTDESARAGTDAEGEDDGE